MTQFCCWHCRRLGLAKKPLNHPSFYPQQCFNPSVESKVLNFAQQQHPELQLFAVTTPAGYYDGPLVTASTGALRRGAVCAWQPEQVEHLAADDEMLADQQHAPAAGEAGAPAVAAMLASSTAAGELSILPLQHLTFGSSLDNTSSSLLQQHMLPLVDGRLWLPHAQLRAEGPASQQQQPTPDDSNSEMMAIMADILAEEDSTPAADVGACPDAAMESLTQLLLQPLQQQQQGSPHYADVSVSGAATPAGSDVSGSVGAAAAVPKHLLAAASSSESSQLLAAAGAASNSNAQLPQQQQQQRNSPLALSCCGEVVLFIDTSSTHLLRLYAKLTANSQLETGLLAVQWVSRVRRSLYAPHKASSSSGSPPPPPPPSVRAAVMHTSASLVSLAASGSAALPAAAGAECVPSSWDHLCGVVEGLLQELMTLRGLCTGLSAGERLSSNMLQAWQRQLQAQASTHVGQAVAALLGGVLDGCH